MTRKYTTEMIAQALEQYNGYIFLAAESLGCNHKTIYRRLKDVCWLQEHLEFIRGKEIDITEMALHRAIMDGEPWAISLKLKTQGKDRGYTERAEIAGIDSEPIQFIIKNVSDTD